MTDPADKDAEIAALKAEVADLRAWKEHILSHEDRKKRPFSDAFAQAVIADQVKEIDRLHSLVAAERRRAESAEARVKELEAGLRPFADAIWNDDGQDDSRCSLWESPEATNLTIGDLRQARELLSPKDKTNG